MSKSLEELRGEIDRLDDEIVRLLNRRAAVAVEIGRIKTARGDALYVPARERSVFKRLMALNGGPLSHASLCRIYAEVMASSLALEHHDVVLTGGADNEALNHAVAFMTGGNAETRMFSTPADLVAAARNLSGGLAVVPDAWAVEVAAAGTESMLRWSGCWLLDGTGGIADARFHLFTPPPDAQTPKGPVTLYCMVESPGSAMPGWIGEVPARSAAVTSPVPGTDTCLVKFRLEMDDRDALIDLVHRLQSRCRAIWMT